MTEQFNIKNIEPIKELIFSVIPNEDYVIIDYKLTDGILQNAIVFWTVKYGKVLARIDIEVRSICKQDISFKEVKHDIYFDLSYIASKRAELLKQYQTMKELANKDNCNETFNRKQQTDDDIRAQYISFETSPDNKINSFCPFIIKINGDTIHVITFTRYNNFNITLTRWKKCVCGNLVCKDNDYVIETVTGKIISDSIDKKTGKLIYNIEIIDIKEN